MTEPAPDTAAVTATPAPETPVVTPTPETPANADPTPTPSEDFALPDEYKEKPWAEKIKSQEDVYKQLDNLNSLVGKKTIQPIDYETASEAEVEAHYASLAPEDVAAYDFGEGAEPEVVEAIAPVLQKYGLTPHQFEGVRAELVAIAGNLDEGREAYKRDSDEYIKMLEQSFGSDHINIGKQVDNSIQKYASPKDKEFFDNISDNETRIAVDRTIHNILKMHGVSETGAQTGESGGNDTPSVNIDDRRADLRKQIRDMDGKAFMDEKLQKLKTELADTYK